MRNVSPAIRARRGIKKGAFADPLTVPKKRPDPVRPSVLTGFCGPNAYKALKAANIDVANDASGSVKDAVNAYLDGKLPLANEANAEAQW